MANHGETIPGSTSGESVTSDSMTGSCLCGSITIDIEYPDLFSRRNGHLCYCRNCRKNTGATHVNILFLKTSNLKVSDPKDYLKTYTDQNTLSGNSIPRSFCSNCGSTLGAFSKSMDAKASAVCLGLFDVIPEPEFELFVKDRPHWAREAVEGCEQIWTLEGVKEHLSKHLG